MASHTVLVIGSTGNIGAATVNALSAKGIATRAGVRSPESDKAAALSKLPNVKVVQADLGSPETLPAALDGVNAVFIVTPGAENRTDLATAGITAAKTAGVGSIVVVSVTSMAEKGDLLFKRQFTPIEDAVKTSEIPYTLLRLPLFMDNQWANQGSIQGQAKIYSPNTPATPTPMVAVADVGAAAANILAAPAPHAKKTYSLVSEHVSFNQVIDVFSGAIGTPVEYVQVPYDAAIDAMVGLGFPRWQAGGVAELLQLIDADTEVKPSTADLAGVLGRSPTTFKQWVDGVAAAFAPKPQA